MFDWHFLRGIAFCVAGLAVYAAILVAFVPVDALAAVGLI